MALMGLEFPANRISGRLKDNSNVNTWNRGQQVLRAFDGVSNPDTTDQQAVRTTFSIVTKNWKNLSGAQTTAWDAFAAANPIVNRLGRTVSRTGLSAYVELASIHYYRTGVLLTAAPTLPQPAPPSLVSIPGGQPNGANLDLIVTHSLVSIVNTWWLVRATPNLPSVKVTPGLGIYRMIKGVAAGSFIAAAASPDSISFTTTKYTYTDQDYIGVEVQTVNIEGWASLPVRVQGLYLV